MFCHLHNYRIYPGEKIHGEDDGNNLERVVDMEATDPGAADELAVQVWRLVRSNELPHLELLRCGERLDSS